MMKLTVPLLLTLAVSTPALAGQKDIVDTAIGAGQFKTLTKLVTDAGLVDTLRGQGPFTVFAPTDKAFAKLPKSLVSRLVGDKELLTKVLTYHVVSGKVLSTDLKNHLKVKTVEGETLLVKINALSKSVKFNKSGLVKADVLASNGVIHVIDTVLVPPSVLKALGH